MKRPSPSDPVWTLAMEVKTAFAEPSPVTGQPVAASLGGLHAEADGSVSLDVTLRTSERFRVTIAKIR